MIKYMQGHAKVAECMHAARLSLFLNILEPSDELNAWAYKLFYTESIISDVL